MDPRSGRISIRDAGDVIPSEDTRLVQAAKAVNLDPSTLNDILIRLKLTVSSIYLRFPFIFFSFRRGGGEKRGGGDKRRKLTRAF